MKRSNVLLLIVCLALLAGLVMLSALRNAAKPLIAKANKPPTASSPRSPAKPTPARPATTPPDHLLPNPSGHPDAAAFGSPAIPPEREAVLLHGFLEAYRREFGSFPAGNENAHFLNALAGTNPAGLVIFPHNHPRVSNDGELLDSWGKPFHFHPVSRDHLEVRSGGPDGILFTADDLTAGSRSAR